jgi:hypothetical protein
MDLLVLELMIFVINLGFFCSIESILCPYLLHVDLYWISLGCTLLEGWHLPLF